MRNWNALNKTAWAQPTLRTTYYPPSKQLLDVLKTTKDIYDLSDLLCELKKKDISRIEEYLPVLLRHHSWIIRTDALAIIGMSQIQRYKKDVLKILKSDKNFLVRKWALSAYHQLSGNKAIPILKQYTKDGSLHVRLCSLLCLYESTQKKAYLSQIKEKIFRKNIHIGNKHLVLTCLCDYSKNKKDVEVLLLIKGLIELLGNDDHYAKEISCAVRRKYPFIFCKNSYRKIKGGSRSRVGYAHAE